MRRSRAQTAYEEDLRRKPFYDGGRRRRAWSALDDDARQAWYDRPEPRGWFGKQFRRARFAGEIA